MLSNKNKKNIRNSKIFMVVGTKNYFNDYNEGGDLKDQVDYAKSLGKPFRVFADFDVVIPEDFKTSVEDYAVKRCDITNPDTMTPKEYTEFLGLSEKDKVKQ